MVLKGSLGTFDIVSIIQMITSQQATGVLHITAGDTREAFDILIDNGMLVRIVPLSGHSKRRAPGAAVRYILDRLAKAGLIDDRQTKSLLDAAKKEGLSEYLIPERSPVPAAVVKKLITTITYECLHRMHGMKAGSYEFEPHAIEYDTKFCEPVNAEFILMESSRVYDEIAHINRSYGDALVLSRAGPPQDNRDTRGTGTEGPVAEGASVSPGPAPKEPLSPQDAVLGLVDGSRTLRDIYYRSLLSRGAVILEIDSLLSSGKIGILSKGSSVARRRRSSFAAGIFAVSRSILMLLLTVCVAAAVLYYSDINPLRQAPTRVNVAYANVLQYLGRYQQIMLSNAIEIYRLEYGSYPQSLKALVDRRIVQSKDLTFPYGNEYYYTVEGTRYILLVPRYP